MQRDACLCCASIATASVDSSCKRQATLLIDAAHQRSRRSWRLCKSQSESASSPHGQPAPEGRIDTDLLTIGLSPPGMAEYRLLYFGGDAGGAARKLSGILGQASAKRQAKVSGRPFGFQSYGYQWWLGSARDDAHTQWIMAVGNGGQRIMLIPSRDLVMVMTAGMYNSPAQTDVTFEVLLDGVLPAVK